MRRRFGRGKRGSAETRDTPIDAARWLTRIVEAGLVPVSSLEPMESEGVVASYAALGKRAEAEDTFERGIDIAEARGDIQTAKEMRVFLRRLHKRDASGA